MSAQVVCAAFALSELSINVGTPQAQIQQRTLKQAQTQ
jgi:hypothetical protein